MNDNEPMKKFKWRAGEALGAAQFSAFLADFAAGALKPFQKSEAEPCEFSEGEGHYRLWAPPVHVFVWS